MKKKDWKNLKNLVVDRDKTGEWTLEGCIDEEGMNTLISFIEAREDRAREETLNDFWTYFDEGKSELLELEDKGSMSLEEIEWDFGEERFKEYINKLTI